ncbi:hypothetical protein V2J09_001607 [Rumex salicifolius]
MSSSKLIFSLSLIFFLHLHTTSSSTDLLFHNCSTSIGNNFNSSTSRLLKLLTSKQTALSTTGFAIATVGPKSPDPAYGLALCRGDVPSSDCLSCVTNATRDCLLKYSNSNYFGKIDKENRFYMWNVNSARNPSLLNDKARELLEELAEEAVNGGDYRMFAAGEMELNSFGLVQCTRDLTKDDCKKCLDEVIRELPSCCDGEKVGELLVGVVILDMRSFHLLINISSML